MTKVCVKCGSTEFSDRGDCRPCKREYDKVYRAENKAKVAAAKKKAYEAKSDYYIQKSKSTYETNKPSILSKMKEYRGKNRVEVLQVKKAYRETNKEKIAKFEKEYYEKNKEKVNLRSKNYRAENPHVSVNAKAKRRSRIGDDKLSRGIFTKLLLEQRCLCNGCGKELGTERKFVHVDHILPLSKGGRNIDDNVQLLCARCNQTKSAKHPEAWKPQNPQTTSTGSYSCESSNSA